MNETRHVVRRLPAGDDLRDHLSGPVVVATFDTHEDALADQRTREQAGREQVVNPFRLRQGRLVALTSLEPGIFRDWLLDLGLEPPGIREDGSCDWGDWWERCSSRWSSLQREQVWDRLDLLRFFDVVAQQPLRRAYVVLEVGWHWCDEPPYDGDHESRLPVEVFTTRERAEVRRRDLEREARANWRGCRVFSWPDMPAGHTGDLEQVPLYEVVEIDWEDER